MRKIIYITMTLVFMVGFYSCEKDLMDYEGKEGVYFAIQRGTGSSSSLWPYMPYSDVEFLRVFGDETVAYLKVMITGPIKEYDRTFKAAIDEDVTTAVAGSYELVSDEIIVPAGEYTANVELLLRRTPDLQIETKSVGVMLIPTDDFELSFPEWDAVPGLTSGTVIPNFDASRHEVRVNDFLVPPRYWNGEYDQTTGLESGYLGAFSKKKMDLITELTGTTYERLDAQFPYALLFHINRRMSAYLQDMYDAGVPILELDGRLMWVAFVSWNSYVGVPWIPEP